MSRRLGLVLVVASSVGVTTGCTLARDVTSTLDGGRVANDAVVIPGVDAFVPGVDAFVAPGVDAYVAPGVDAYVRGVDAYVAPGVDAYVAPRDAYVGPDTYIAPIDAYIAPIDAWTQPTCAMQYGGSTMYMFCAMDDSSCTFYVMQNRDSCDTVCAAGGGRCIAAADSNAPAQCVSVGTLTSGDCDSTRGDGMCQCSRP